MLLHNLSPNVLTKRITVDGTNWTGAAGLTALTSEVIDTRGYHGVRFIISLGPIVAGALTSVKAQQGLLANMSDAADIAGSGMTIVDTADNKIAILELFRPYERYIRLVTTRGTQNATIDNVIVELLGPSDVAVTQDATVANYEFFNGSAEGTA